GRDKTLLRHDGERVVGRLADLLSGVCEKVLLVARDEMQAQSFRGMNGVEVVHDAEPNSGPLGGLATALEHSRDDVFLLACDLPFVEAGLLRKIRAEFDARKPIALLPRTPMCATGLSAAVSPTDPCVDVASVRHGSANGRRPVAPNVDARS